jgi:cysteine desulfurase
MVKIYLDNAATTLMAPEVAEAMRKAFIETYGNSESIHDAGKNAAEELEAARARIARTINALPEEIIFTSGGTESNNLALLGTLKDRDHLIISAIEHPSILNTSKKFNTTVLPVDKEGIISLEELKKTIKPETKLVSIMHANNEIGTIQPIEEIAQICKQKNVLFHTDAVQSYKKIPIDVTQTPIDLITITAHKIHGPKGIGAIYIRKGIQITPLLHGGDHERKIRPGTVNVPAAIAFATAADFITRKDIEKITQLRDLLLKLLTENIPDLIVNGSIRKRLCNNVNISIKNIEAETLLEHLNHRGIYASTGSACTSHNLEPSHVLKSIKVPASYIHGSVRLTLSKYTNEEEIRKTTQAIMEITKELRKLT